MTSTCPEAAFPTFCKLCYVCGWIILCWGSCAGHCEMFGPNPWSLPSRCQEHPPHCDNENVSSHHPGTNTDPMERHCCSNTRTKNHSSTAAAHGRGFSHKPMRSPLQESPVISNGCGALKEQHSLSQRMPLFCGRKTFSPF